MKTFISLSVCAMISAGIYGIIDMSRDVAKGTMIDYRKAELENKERVVVITDVHAHDPKIQGSLQYVKNLVKGNKKPEPLLIDYKSYSRGGFEQPIDYVEAPVISDSVILAREEHRAELAVAGTRVDPVVEPVVMSDSVLAPTPEFDYSIYSRGAPRKKKPVKVVVEKPASDSAHKEIVKDGL